MKLKVLPVITLVATMLLSSTVFGATGKVINGRTMIPLRGAFEELGFSVSWDNARSSAKLKDSNHVIVVTQNSKLYTVDGTQYTSDIAPQAINGSLYIPLKTLGEKIGAKIGWYEDTQTATIKYNGYTSTITTSPSNSSSTSKSTTSKGGSFLESNKDTFINYAKGAMTTDDGSKYYENGLTLFYYTIKYPHTAKFSDVIVTEGSRMVKNTEGYKMVSVTGYVSSQTSVGLTKELHFDCGIVYDVVNNKPTNLKMYYLWID